MSFKLFTCALWRGLMILVLITPIGVRAGPWFATTSQNMRVIIVQDSARTRDGYVLERRYPDGQLDASFGQSGSTVFALGPDNEGPAALRLDAMGRIWIAGAALDARGVTQPVVLRFTPQGLVDASWATQGRSTAAPSHQGGARALDLAPDAHGGADIVGLLSHQAGHEQIAWWRLKSDGSLDASFGEDQAWRDAEVGSASVVQFERAANGTVRLGLERSGGHQTAMHDETWVAGPTERSVRREPRAVSQVAPTSLGAPQPTSGTASSAPNAGASPPSPEVPHRAQESLTTSGASTERATDPWSGKQLFGVLSLAFGIGVMGLAWRKRQQRRGP